VVLAKLSLHFNPSTATGDGVAMAYRLARALDGLEFYQFHPNLLSQQIIIF